MPPSAAYGAAAPIMVSFCAGTTGEWQVIRQSTWIGEPLPQAARLAVDAATPDASWTLTGFTSNLRYTTRAERQSLDARTAAIGRPEARMAALIPIRKSAVWWAMAQDDRRAIYERSGHTPIGRGYLPAIARRLHHSRDLGQPFDFLTWFEFAPDAEPAFEELLAQLRITPEWRYVEREVDIRLVRID